MVKKLTNNQKAYYRRIYDQNEAVNYHRANAGMLIKLFGTKAEKDMYKKIALSHTKKGYLNEDEWKWLYKHGHKKFNKLRSLK